MVKVKAFRAARVSQSVKQKLASPRLSGFQERSPPWLKVVESIPPAELLTRPVPVQHRAPDPRMRKPRNIYKPQQIVYEEDELRREFFKDHPWELARPRIIVEMDGKDARYCDWSRGLRQPGVPLSGESVVQRQLWMMHNVTGITKEQAYDSVRREFYALRQEEQVEKRIAQEEARMVGAYFGKSTLQVGTGLEDKQFELWKSWATGETAKMEAERNAQYMSFGDDDATAAEELAEAEVQPRQ